MRVTHDLKTWREPFEAVWTGRKRYEIRRNDRNYQVGDLLRLREWDQRAEEYTGRIVTVEVRYMTDGGTWDIPTGVCVMSFEEVATPPAKRRREARVK